MEEGGGEKSKIRGAVPGVDGFFMQTNPGIRSVALCPSALHLFRSVRFAFLYLLRLPGNMIFVIFMNVSRKYVNLVVTCTARKTVPVPASLMMRSLSRDRLDRRFSDWNKRIRNEIFDRKKATDLYCGNSWSVIREMTADEKLPSRLRIWVISAGHGLVSIDENLAPYAATFTPRGEDSVIPPELSSHSVAEWWDMLVSGRRQAGTSVASISDI